MTILALIIGVVGLLSGVVTLLIKVWPSRQDKSDDEAKKEMIDNETKIRNMFDDTEPK